MRSVPGQGREVFAISLTLQAAKENRNGSRRTLPALKRHDAKDVISIERKIEMPQPSRELEQTESVLQSVIDNLLDSQEAFQQIGSELKDELLKSYFLAESLKRAEFRGEIESVLHQEGVQDIRESGTTAGTVHRVWAGLKSRLGGGDHTLLATAEQGEDATTQVYEKAIGTRLPLPVRQLLTSQAAHIRLAHDSVKAARDKKAG